MAPGNGSSPADDPTLDGLHALLPEWVARRHEPPEDLGAAACELRDTLAVLRRARTEIDLKLGHGLYRVKRRCFDPMALGEMGIGGLARNWLGLSGSEASELVSLHEGLQMRDYTRWALVLGDISRGHALELMRVPYDRTEAGWVELACSMPVAELRRYVNAHLKRTGGSGFLMNERIEEPGRPHPCGLTLEAPEWMGSFLRTFAKDLVEKASGHPLDMPGVFDRICGEYLSGPDDSVSDRGVPHGFTPTRLLDEPVERPTPSRLPDPPAPDPYHLRDRELPFMKKIYGRPRDAATRAAEKMLEGLPNPNLAEGPWELLDCLRALVRLRQSLDWQMGRALAAGMEIDLPRRVGFRSWGALVEKLLGRSARWARRLRRLDRELERLPLLRAAYRAGRLGSSKIEQLIRIATPETEGAWIERAERVTLLRLRGEIEAMVALRSLCRKTYDRLTHGGGPPSEALLLTIGILPTGCRCVDWLSLLRVANVRIFGEGSQDESSEEAAVHRSGHPLCRLRFHVSFRTARLLRKVLWKLAQERGMKDATVALLYLVHHFRVVQEHAAAKLQGPRPVMEAFGWRCAWPGCTARCLEDHHLRYRSRGGGDELWNRIPLCPLCRMRHKAHHADSGIMPTRRRAAAKTGGLVRHHAA